MTHRTRRLVVSGLVVTLAGFVLTAQAWASTPGRIGGAQRGSPTVSALATRVDISAVLRGGGQTRPTASHGRQMDAIGMPRAHTGVGSGQAMGTAAATGAVGGSRDSTDTSDNWSGYVVEGGAASRSTTASTLPTAPRPGCAHVDTPLRPRGWNRYLSPSIQ